MALIQRSVFVALVILNSPAVCSAQTWSGAGANSNWTTAQNWVGNIAPVSGPSTYLHFQGSVPLTSLADANSPWVLNRIDFETRAFGGPNSFVISGNPLSFQGAAPELYVYASAVQTINNDIDIAGSDLTVESLTGQAIILNGHVSGPGGLAIPSSRVFLTNSNSYQGTTTIGASPTTASVTISNGHALGPAGTGGVIARLGCQVRLSGGIVVESKPLALSTGSGFNSNGLMSVGGNNTWTGPISLSFTAAFWSLVAGETLTVSGDVDGNNRTMQMGGIGDIVVSGAIRNLHWDLSKYGTGTLTLSGNNSNIEAINIGDGTLVALRSSALPYNTPIQLIPNSGVPFQDAHPTLRIEEDATIGGLSNHGSGGTATVQLGSHVLTISQGFDATYSGTFTGSGAITKTGAGVLTLSAVSNYTGGTFINAGTLRFNVPGAIGPSGMLKISDGATAVPAYAINQTLLSRVDPTSAGILALGVPSGNDLDFNTPGLGNVFFAAVGAQIYSGSIVAANEGYRLGGLGTITLTKQNALSGDTSLHAGIASSTASRVTLSNNNSFNGDTMVHGGTLEVSASTLDCNHLEVESQATLQLTSGIVAADVVVDALGALRGCGTITGSLTNSGSVVVDCTPGLAVTGPIINNGTMTFLGGAILTADGTFVNNGLLDLLTSPGTILPPGFVNHGTVIYPSDVKVRSVSKSGTTFSLRVQSFTGHNYQLQRNSTLGDANWQNVGAVIAGATGSDITLIDSTVAPEQFYRVRVSP
jgi:fibronectin-binding autotransporter adhesin